MEKKKHWENIYQTKKIDGVSWYQETPYESIELIKKYSTTDSDMIIDRTKLEVKDLIEKTSLSEYNNPKLLDIGCGGGDHLSSPLAAMPSETALIYQGGTMLPSGSSSQPGDGPGAYVPLFGLAPGGV